jgi:hypothetical protein
MGMETRLYGCIVEFARDENLHYSHNEKIISELPEIDDWPPLSKNMFGITHSNPTDGSNYAYYGRIIHFGASFKTIEYEWKEWKDKFENLLTRLFWSSAYVHMKPFYADIQTFKWHINFDKWQIGEGDILDPIKPEHWDFEGDRTWENFK